MATVQREATAWMCCYYSAIYLIGHDTTTHQLKNKDTNGLVLVYCHVYQLTFIIIQAGVKANIVFLRNTKIGRNGAEHKSQ
jgi:hypothetical protein